MNFIKTCFYNHRPMLENVGGGDWKMSYLGTFVGRVITVNLTDATRDDRMMKLFYETDTHKDFIGNK